MQLTTPLAPAPTQQIQRPTHPHRYSADKSRRELDRTLSSMPGGVDLRLILGMLAPMLLVIGLIVSLVQGPTYWLLGLTLAIELCCLGLVVKQALAMMDEPDETTGS